MFKLSGTLKVINDTTPVTEKFTKREFVLTDSSGMYPQDILFQLTQDKCSLLDGYQVGEQVDVSFNLRGREWKNPQGEVKYFNSLEAWRIEKIAQGMPQGGPSSMSMETPMPVNMPSSSLDDSEDDDLPF